MRAIREWDGQGVWSSHPVPNPGTLNRQAFSEVLALLAWDERFAKAFRRAMADYMGAGSPGIPLGSRDYRKQYASRLVGEMRNTAGVEDMTELNTPGIEPDKASQFGDEG